MRPLHPSTVPWRFVNVITCDHVGSGACGPQSPCQPSRLLRCQRGDRWALHVDRPWCRSPSRRRPGPRGRIGSCGGRGLWSRHSSPGSRPAGRHRVCDRSRTGHARHRSSIRPPRGAGHVARRCRRSAPCRRWLGDRSVVDCHGPSLARPRRRIGRGTPGAGCRRSPVGDRASYPPRCSWAGERGVRIGTRRRRYSAINTADVLDEGRRALDRRRPWLRRLVLLDSLGLARFGPARASPSGSWASRPGPASAPRTLHDPVCVPAERPQRALRRLKCGRGPARSAQPRDGTCGPVRGWRDGLGRHHEGPQPHPRRCATSPTDRGVRQGARLGTNRGPNNYRHAHGPKRGSGRRRVTRHPGEEQRHG